MEAGSGDPDDHEEDNHQNDDVVHCWNTCNGGSDQPKNDSSTDRRRMSYLQVRAGFLRIWPFHAGKHLTTLPQKFVLSVLKAEGKGKGKGTKGASPSALLPFPIPFV